jgi:hypothetical protein
MALLKASLSALLALWATTPCADKLSAPEVFSSYVAFRTWKVTCIVSQVDGRFVSRTRIDGEGLRARHWLRAAGYMPLATVAALVAVHR